MLEHGKPEERSSIIQKLSGQVVILSKQKFASNVIEKCLAFGTPEERDSLIGEIISSGQTFQVCPILYISIRCYILAFDREIIPLLCLLDSLFRNIKITCIIILPNSCHGCVFHDNNRCHSGA